MNNKIPKLSKNPAALDMLAKLVNEGCSDKDIQNKLKEAFGHLWSRNTIFENKKKLGLTPSHTDHPASVSSSNFSQPPMNLSDDNKAEWFRSKFKNTHLYKALFDQFTIDEINVYIQEYGIICCQFEDLVVSEFFQIDDFLKHRILINRQLFDIKRTQEEIDELSIWLKTHTVTVGESDDIKNQRTAVIRSIDTRHNVLDRTSERYDSLVKERDKIHKALAATRKDRLDEIKHGTTSFFDLVLQIQQSEKMRNQHGKYCELTKLSAKDIGDKYREDIIFPDGTEEPIILDSEYMDKDNE